jgi:hypothetical protein
MNAIKRLSLAVVLIIALAMLSSTALAQDADGVVKQKMIVAGTILDGTSVWPDTPVTVRLYRDKGCGGALIREETYPGRRIDRIVDGRQYEEWDNTFSVYGDWLFMVNCVTGYYTVEIDGFMQNGAEALGVAWWDGQNGRRHLLKTEQQQPGPWTLSWYQECSGRVGADVLKDHIMFEYSAAPGPRPASTWMQLTGRVFDPDIPAAQRFDACGNPVYAYWDVDPFQAVKEATVRVERLAQRQSTPPPDLSISAGVVVGTAATTTKGHWEMTLMRRPGLYRIAVESVPTGAVASQALYLHVGSEYGYGLGSVWLPWDMDQSAWGYSNLNFVVQGSKRVRTMDIPCDR